MFINKKRHKRNPYKITVGIDKEFKVYAHDEQEAVDLVADYIEEKELEGLYHDWYGLFDLCEPMQTPDEYAEANGYSCVGNSGIYVQIIRVEELKI